MQFPCANFKILGTKTLRNELQDSRIKLRGLVLKQTSNSGVACKLLTITLQNEYIRRPIENKKASKKSRLICGSWGVRTPDPLLVRQMLWTSWAKLPFSLAEFSAERSAKIGAIIFLQNFSGFLRLKSGKKLKITILKRRRFPERAALGLPY